MIFGKPPRAYAFVDGRWRHVYIQTIYTQVDIFGENSKMASVYLTKKSKDLYHIEVAKLENKKPTKRTVRKESS